METPYRATPLENIRQAGSLLLVLGAISMVLGFLPALLHQHHLATRTERATGTVVGQLLYKHYRDVKVLRVIEFRTASGLTQRFQAEDILPGFGAQKGEQVPVAYDPANPGQAMIDDIRQSVYPLLAADSIGIFLLIGGAWVLTRFTSPDDAANQQAA